MYVMIFFSFFRILFRPSSLIPPEGGSCFIAVKSCLLCLTFLFLRIDDLAIPSIGTFLCPSIRNRRLNPSSSLEPLPEDFFPLRKIDYSKLEKFEQEQARFNFQWAHCFLD